MIRVLIAEDHHMVRQSLRLLIEKASDIRVIGEAKDGLEAIEQARRLRPDVLVMDIKMPHLDGIETAQRLRKMNIPVVFLTQYNDAALVQKARQSGGQGYVLKHAEGEDLLEAIRVVSRGGEYFSERVTACAPMKKPDPYSNPDDISDPSTVLTPREREVLQLVVEGCKNSEIAERLQITLKTVEKHRKNMMEKLRVKNLPELFRVALKYGLIDLER
jgi:DNA-binding NarL/FixJ family response regulator